MKPYQSRMTPISFAPGQKPQLFLALMAIEQSGMVGEDRRDGFGINVDGVSASFLEAPSAAAAAVMDAQRFPPKT
jgi:hypothetical protein